MSIADSDAFRDDDRVLSQHQVAATLLATRLVVPGTESVHWLDLACGRGQLVRALDSALTADSRRRLHYWAVDADQTYAREAVRAARDRGLGSATFRVSELSAVDGVVGPEGGFDFITLTNALHEVTPGEIPTLLVRAMEMLNERGALFVYDLEVISPPELGAVAWTGDEVQRIVWRLFEVVGVHHYRPEVQRWKHRTTVGWSLHLEREYFAVDKGELRRAGPDAASAAAAEIRYLLESKLEACRATLASLTRFGAETGEEEAAKEALLYDYWALNLAREAMG